MDLRLALPLVAFLFTPALFAQEERLITDEDVVVPAPVAEPEESNEPHTVVEQMPEFPGGHQAMMKYLTSKLRYPEAAMENGTEGKVFIAFVVERDGSIGEVKVLRGIGSGCDEEAIRVVKGMPKWKPGQQNGKVVRTRFNLPIMFKLQDQTPKQ